MSNSSRDLILQELRKWSISADDLVVDATALRTEARSTNLWPRDEDIEVIAIARPRSREQVQALIKIANKMSFPLWTVSRGRNWGYGSMRPLLTGCVVLSLERMNRILEINEEMAYAVIEAGVSYRELRNYLSTNHPELWSDCTDGPPEGSVIGNALDRGLGVTHLGDHFGSICGMEILLADGQIIKTGGGPENCATWNTHKWGVGPYLEGIFTQSNFGIVLSAGVWLLRKPKCFESFVFDLKSSQHLGRMIDQIRELFLAGILTSFTHIVNDIVTMAVLSKFPQRDISQMNRRKERLSRENRPQNFADQLGVPCWSFGGGLLGEREQVRFVKKKLKQSLAGLGRLEFVTDRTIRLLGFLESGIDHRFFLRRWLSALGLKILSWHGLTADKIEAAPYIHDVLKGIPSDYFVRHAYLKSRLPKPDDAHPERDELGLIWCAPILPMSGKHVDRILENNKKIFAEAGFEFYVALLVQNARSLICLHGIFFDPRIKSEVEGAQALYLKLRQSVNELGYQEYRVPLIGMPQLFKADEAYERVLAQIKSALDPENILSPGKYGIRGPKL